MERLAKNLLGLLDVGKSLPSQLVSIAPIALIAAASLVSLNSLLEQYRFTQKEIQGTKDIEYIIKINTLLKEIRGLRQFPKNYLDKKVITLTSSHKISDDYRPKPSNPFGATKQSEKQITITKNIKELHSAVSKKLVDPELLAIIKRYGVELDNTQLIFDTVSGQHTVSLSDFRNFSEAIEELIDYSYLILDKSNLILDPQIDTYYLIVLTTDSLLHLIDHIAELRGLQIAMINTTPQDTKNWIKQRRISQKFIVEHELEKMNRIMNILSVSAPKTYQKMRINRVDIANRLEEYKSSDFEPNNATTPEENISSWNSSTRFISILENIQRLGLNSLKEKLEQRSNDIQIEMSIIILLSSLGILSIHRLNKKLYGDLSKALKLNEELANVDPLTKLQTRRSMELIYQNEYFDRSKSQNGYGVCIFDIDHFKLYNDLYGHQMGDEALLKVSQLLETLRLKYEYNIFRYGGEEFVLFTEISSETNMELYLENIRKAIERLEIEHKSSKTSNVLTISMGAVFIPSNYAHVELRIALQIADKQLYRAKEASRNYVSVVSISPTLERIVKKDTYSDYSI